MDLVWEIIKAGDREGLELVYDGTTVMGVLSSALRGALIPSEGLEYYVADYAGIEARPIRQISRRVARLSPASPRTPPARRRCWPASAPWRSAHRRSAGPSGNRSRV